MNTLLNRTLARLLLLPIILVGLGLLVKGYQEGGGGFSAGVFAALGVLLQYVVFGAPELRRAVPVIDRLPLWLAASGLGLMLLVSFAPLLLGLPPVSQLPQAGSELIHIGVLGLHTALLFELGIFLLVLGFSVGVIDLLQLPGADNR